MNSKRILPSANVILDVINEEANAEEKVLNFYENYIVSASKEIHYNAESYCNGAYINEDLAQDIRLAVFNCLPYLRKAFQKKF
jgi:hypothetical protein